MNSPPSAGDIHAYVDNSLSRDERARFEARLREDEELRRRVYALRAQNEAIRAAFGAAPVSRNALSLGTPANRDATRQAPVEPGVRRGARWEELTAAAECAAAGETTSRLGSSLGGLLYRTLLFSACVALWWLAGTSGGASDPRAALMESGLAAYRAFAVANPLELDIATGDMRELARNLGPRFQRLDLATAASGEGLTLRGAKFVPGVAGPAALVVFDTALGRRAGLLIEPLDAPASRPPLMISRSGLAFAARTADGFGIAAIGPDAAADATAPP